tara:strand:- start:442 stop:702 length:261 start_codon:yes stop_codon:yes gene_type:complete
MKVQILKKVNCATNAIGNETVTYHKDEVVEIFDELATALIKAELAIEVKNLKEAKIPKVAEKAIEKAPENKALKTKKKEIKKKTKK